jgi:hypothetical protein
MIFQTFDDKEKCILIYQNEQFHSSLENLDLSATWVYANYLGHKDIEYAQLWVQGATLGEVCPSHLKGALQGVEDRLKAFIRSCGEAKIDLTEVCFYELVPENFLRAYANIKNDIASHIFHNSTRPTNYAQLLKIVKVISEIKYHPLKLDLRKMKKAGIKDRNMFKTLSSCHPYVAYDPFKTVTGRLATQSRTFPALTLAKEYRTVLAPTNDWLFELDFNAAELRTVLALLGETQPTEDLHAWNIKNLFSQSLTREEAKKRIFAWLYNPNKVDAEINRIYDRDKIQNLYHKNGAITTDFQRTIECDAFHATNYVIQSTSADILFEQMYKIWEYLRDKKSFIKFCNHDSIMIDLSNEDQMCVNEIKEIFSNTRYGKFKINCLGGKNWGKMRPMKVH